MKKAAAHPTPSTSHVTPTLSVGSMGAQFLDTLWRVGAPVLLFTAVGLVADRHFGTKPWLTLLGTAVGFVGAGLLIKRLIAETNTATIPTKPKEQERRK